MGREDNIEKEFSEYLDRILAGEEVVVGDEASNDLRTALDFARRMIELRGEPSTAFARAFQDSPFHHLEYVCQGLCIFELRLELFSHQCLTWAVKVYKTNFEILPQIH